MPPNSLHRWKGLLLTSIGVVATIWLASTGQLGLYIHPRYFDFTVGMAVAGGIVAFGALAVPTHDSHEPAPPRFLFLPTLLVIVFAAIGMIALPPNALSAQTAAQRDITRSTADLKAEASELQNADRSRFTIKDWAMQIQLDPDPESYAGEMVTLTGFVAPSPGDKDDEFYITRFLVLCCAVDAQPIGLPVRLQDWKAEFAVDGWLDVTGEFAENPDGKGLVLVPDEITPTEQSNQPYVY